ncbi:MAG: DUF6982 domain-containing protein [Terriglobales bacterium]
MNTSNRKKALVRAPGSGPLQPGFVNVASLEAPTERLELLTPEGQRLELDWRQVQAVYLVSEFEAGREAPPASGPRHPGVWVRVRGKDRSTMDGILASDLLEIEGGLWLLPLQDGGFFQRAYIPRGAVAGLSVLEVIKPARRRGGRTTRRPGGEQSQISLFSESAPETQ